MAGNSKKSGLGRGIDTLFATNNVNTDAIIAATDHAQAGEPVTVVTLKNLTPNPFQPRKTFDETALDELSDSIKSNGIIQPIVVRQAGDQYQIVAGERRFRAAQKAHLTDVPVVIRDLADDAMMEIAIIENLQRENLNAIEEANGIKLFMDRLQLTQEQAADRLNKSRAAIANLLRLLKLPQLTQDAVQDGKLSMGQARALLGLDNERQIETITKRIIRESLTVRQVEDLVNELKQGNSTTNKKTATKQTTTTPFNQAIVDQLENKFGTKVNLGTHKIEINFESTEDLNRLLEIMDVTID